MSRTTLALSLETSFIRYTQVSAQPEVVTAGRLKIPVRATRVSRPAIDAGHLSIDLTFHLPALDLGEGLTGKDLLRLLRKRGCGELRQKGSHVVVRCGKCQTVVPVHTGEDLGPGLLRAIERDLESCLGKGWLRKHRS